mmetsp:Transcript_24052/g.66901  ORF Transcript_24052/g.66901 Transcript_24052/m.66901 type:complete len:333 (-) Transcript_24052:109-1107(-)
MGNPFSRGGYISLKGHSQVAVVRFLPTGEFVTAGDQTMRLWHPETGKPEKVWKFGNDVETLCCSPDGRFIACGVADGLVFVFEARSRQQVAHWQAHADCGQGPLLQFFADSTYLLSAALLTCKIWSSRTTKLINTWDTALLTSANISADCALLAVGSNTGVVVIHNLPDGNAVRRWRAQRSEVWAIVFSPNRSLLATASRDDFDGVRLWSTETWDLSQALRGHSGVVLDCAFSGCGTQLVTCGSDRTLRLWCCRNADLSRLGGGDGNGASWRCEQILVGHGDAVLSCAFSPVTSSGGIVASGARDGAARVWRLADVPLHPVLETTSCGLPLP